MFAISLVDSITVIVAILSSIAAGLNALCAIKMFSYVKNANEIKINEMISNSYNQMLSLSDTQETKYVIKNYKRKRVFFKTHEKDLIIENYFNTMDMACNCYLRNKVDRKSFKAMYKNIIVGYFDNNILSKKIYNKKNSYENIIKVCE